MVSDGEVHEGAFTVASDCERLNKVMESLMSLGRRDSYLQSLKTKHTVDASEIR